MLRTNIVLALLCGLVVMTANAGEYDLESYLRRVEQNNPDLSLAYKELDLAKENVVQARSALLPNIGAQGSYTRNLQDIKQSAPVAADLTTGRIIRQDIDSNYDNELTLGVGVNQTIFDAAALSRYNQARKGREIQEQALETRRQNLRAAAKKLYARTQLAVAVVHIMEASEHTSEEIYQSIERKYKAGVATELDLLMAEVDWKSKIPTTAESRKNAELATIAFKNLGWIPLSEEVVLTETDEALPVIPGTPQLNAVFSGRPDYRALLLNRELSDIGQRAAMSAFLPTVSGGFSFAFGGMGNDSLTGDYDYTSMQLKLGVNIPLFAGGYRLSRMKSAKTEQEKAALSLIKKQMEIESELIEIRLNLDEASERINSARLIEAMARRAVALAQTAYINGAATQLSVTEAINKLDQASLGLHSAIFEYRSAYYDWELATGIVR
ncbi:TolC family protein [Treponema primitia]|nr:TolC family protein [Treponema primitia]